MPTHANMHLKGCQSPDAATCPQKALEVPDEKPYNSLMRTPGWIIASLIIIVCPASLRGDETSSGKNLPKSSASAASPTTITSATCPICRRANNQNTPYPERATVSLVRGATNTAFGWTELLVEPTNEVERGGNLALGIGKGVGRAVTRTAAGIGEMFTFWLPKTGATYPSLATDCPICLQAGHHTAEKPAAEKPIEKPAARH